MLTPPAALTDGGLQYSKKDCYQKALECDPKDAVTWKNLGNAGGGTVGGLQYPKKDCYQKALECGPWYTNAWSNLGSVGGGTVGGIVYTAAECKNRCAELEDAAAKKAVEDAAAKIQSSASCVLM